MHYALLQRETGHPVDENGLDGHARGHFEREDRNRDGSITIAEVSERVSQNLARRFRAVQVSLRLSPADIDGDVQLELPEQQPADAGEFGAVPEVSEGTPRKLEDLYGRTYGASLDRTGALDKAIASTCGGC